MRASDLRKCDRRQRGQAIVLFVLMSVGLVGAVAIVTDVAWLWYGQQRMQRAADAASLAGAIYLPGNPATAYSAARAEAAKNGFTNGANGVLVTPLQDSTNKRRLIVTVSGNVRSFFSRLLGFNQYGASATSRAEYVLPVPMGSPQNYYGVGDFLRTTTTTANATGSSDWVTQSTQPSGSWTTPGNANATSDTNYANSTTTTGSAQQWGGFGLTSGGSPPLPSLGGGQTMTIDGIQLELRDLLTGSGVGTTCQIQAQLSWNNGTNWTSPAATVTPTSTKTLELLGSATSTGAWAGHSWTRGDFANLRVRLTFNRVAPTGNCAAAQKASVDTLRVDVYYTITTTTTTTAVAPVVAPDGTTLASQGFWGAVITKGGSRENGDQFDPANDNLKGTSNPDFDPNAVDYAVEVKGSGGNIRIFDATFCETGPNGSGGYMGTGDHWIAGSANAVTTTFKLYDENGTPYDSGDDTLVSTSGNDFAGERQADYSGALGTPGHSGLTDCASAAYHNAWYTLGSGLAAGTYRLNVSTNVAGNNGTNAENMWSVWVTSGGGNSLIHGQSRMIAYNNLPGGTQLFYLAQIAQEHAGKTMEITLFDPGDVSGNAYLRILSPDGNSYDYATFSYTADNGRSGNNVTQIQTASSSGGSFFNDAVITILIVLPTNYGQAGLQPPGESEEAWWKIEYSVNGGNDTTTWQVAIRGNPVHLVP